VHFAQMFLVIPSCSTWSTSERAAMAVPHLAQGSRPGHNSGAGVLGSVVVVGNVAAGRPSRSSVGWMEVVVTAHAPFRGFRRLSVALSGGKFGSDVDGFEPSVLARPELAVLLDEAGAFEVVQDHLQCFHVVVPH